LIHFPRLTACLLGGSAALALSACAATTDMAEAPPAPAPAAQPAATSPAITSAIPAAQMAAVDAAIAANDINAFFQAYEDAGLAFSPETKTYRGIRDEDYGKWDDPSLEADLREAAMDRAFLARMEQGFDLNTLEGQDALSYRLFKSAVDRQQSLVPFRENGYLFNQMFGAQSGIPSFLVNMHRVSDKAEAEAYIERIAGIGPHLDALTKRAVERAEAGVMPPRWVYPYVISDIDNLITPAAPMHEGNAILDDFREKVAALDLPQAEKDTLVADAVAAWEASGLPAYRLLRAVMVQQQAKAGTDDGVWRLPQGEAYYAALLKNYTTTELSADQIHQIGLSNIERIHGEMRAIMEQVGFEGTLQEFFEYTRTDPRFYADSREEYLGKVDVALDAMEAELPKYFEVLPQDALQVKPVEAFREKSAGKAFYSRPAPDGSRPGIYYVNLYKLDSMSLNELEALAFHEGLPGHHLQLSVQTGLGELPPFRRFGGVTAYSEGWGLYSEKLAKDMGFYTDPYSDFGRLQMELWRAARLVVDTGIHSKRWSREQAIQYLTDNTPNPAGDITKAIERYIVYPGQATAYMIGKLKIEELRDKAQAALGDAFDIRAFHTVILENGPVPLNIMEENVDAWIAEVRAS
tara:strand:+ start:119772 stop:121676 length:1905 start_codon:yes stop_codon:yes gene_type:complete